jgi:Restriction endonuclease S subunits
MKNELPDGWEWKRLGDLADFFYGGAFKSSLFNEDGKGTKIIRIRNLKKGMTETYYDGEYDESYLIDNGDILIGMDGEFNIVKWSGKTALLNQRICKLIVKSNMLIPDFAYRALVKILKDIEDKTAFVTVKHLSAKELETIKIPVPPLETQHKIVTILEKAEETKKLRAQADELTQQLLQSVFLDIFGDPAKNTMNWEVFRFDEVGSLQRGKSKHRPRNAPELLGGKYPLIQTGDVANSNGYITKYTQTYSDLGLKQSKMWPAGTLCITIAANIAKTGILTFDACFPDSVVGLTPYEKIKTEYVQYWMSFLQKMIEDSAPESAQKNINLNILSELDIPVPPLELQERFVSIVQQVENTKKLQQKSSQELDFLFNTLMQKAFNGELVS